MTGSSTAIDDIGYATVQSNTIFNSQIGIQFECSTTSAVNSNIINDAVTGLAGVPDSLGSANTYFNVGAIRTSGC
jgi:hypothetical protein